MINPDRERALATNQGYVLGKETLINEMRAYGEVLPSEAEEVKDCLAKVTNSGHSCWRSLLNQIAEMAVDDRQRPAILIKEIFAPEGDNLHPSAQIIIKRVEKYLPQEPKI